MIKKIVAILFILALINACSIKEPEKQESAFIVIKTAIMKYADMGFITSSDSKVKVEIYAAGQPLMDFEINGMNVCMSTFKCMDKESFNKKVLNEAYPEDILENIFRAKPIFNKKNLEEIKGGFKQKITQKKLYDISYSVVSGERKFRDTINKILIKVREQ